MKVVKTLILCFTLLCGVSLLAAQSQDWEWVSEALGSQAYSKDISVDSAGFIYVIGSFEYSLSLGGSTFTNSGMTDSFVAKFNSLGSCLWARQVSANNELYAYSICTDTNGNSYIAGQYGGFASFGGHEVYMAYQYSAMFIAKIDTNGNWLWAKTASGATSGDRHTANGVSCDSLGNCYVVGTKNNNLHDFGSYHVGGNTFIAKLDTNGNWQWAKPVSPGVGITEFNHVSTDSAGNSVVSGRFTGFVEIGSLIMAGPDEGSNSFIAKIDTSGNWIWAKQISGVNIVFINSIDLDQDGNVYTAGNIEGAATFGTISIPSEYGDVFAAKADAEGIWEWVKVTAGDGYAEGFGIDVDPWGACYVTGSYTGNCVFGQYNLSATGVGGYSDVFVAKIDINANWAWVKSAGGASGDDIGKSIVTDTNGNCYLTGHDISLVTAFGPIVFPNDPQIVSYGVYVAKIGAPLIYEIQLQSQSNLDFGSVIIDEASESKAISIYNSGYQTLIFSDIHFQTTISEFEIIQPFSDNLLESGETDTMLIRFSPQTIGAKTDVLYIVNNSINFPILQISLNGNATQVPPMQPENVQIAMDGNSAVVSWNAVTQTSHGTPLTPDYYLVFYNGSSDPTNGLYYYLAWTTNLNYVHDRVGLHTQNMFYRIVAYKSYVRGGIDITSLELEPGMTEFEVWQRLHKL